MYEDHGGKTLRITLNNQLRMLSFHLFGTIMMIITLWLLEFENDFLVVFLFFWLIYTISVMYLHYEYWITNRGEDITLRSSEILIRKNGSDIIVKSEEIKKITIYLSPALYKNSNFQLLAIEAYHYAKVELKLGDEIILTSLLSPKLHKDLKEVKGVLFERRKTLFCQLGLFNKWLSS
ncbi:hypothetical protein L3073_13960 [Ancylomarina sp. DW003]|nr:hypothetical protein [Ancylomarina sp. DW003]MDE5423320.1 hypothetical protein [Ancylomarina sp. DW003]